jgi:ElaB/YqjD/DUF883 family membrane-anchored ribosome-binding protein
MFARAGSRHNAQVRQAAQILNRYPAQVAEEELQLLIATVEDLLARLSHAADPEIARLRKHTEMALVRAKAAIAKGGAQMRGHAEDYAEQAAATIREHPWTWLGVAALCALAIGLWSSRAVMNERGDD